MKNLTLIRHAKASQEFGFKDFDRPILSIGIDNINFVANQFEINNFNNLAIWSSDAKRTIETALIFQKRIGFDKKLIQFKSELYTFELLQLESSIKSCPDYIENLIIFGHNNALTDFSNKYGSLYISNIPTSGLVTIQFTDSTWSNLSKGTTIQTIFSSQNNNEF